MLIDSTTNKL